MIVDVRTYTMVPGRLGAWLALYEAEGMPIHVRHLGQPIGVFTTDVGTVNQVVFFWGFGVRRTESDDATRSRPIPTGSPIERKARKPATSSSGVQDH
jgi:hypothetical protein